MAELDTATRPTSITVISWVWIIIGALMIFSAAMGLFSFIMMQNMAGGEALPPKAHSEMPAGFKPMIIIFRNMHILMGFQIIIAITAIISGIKLLRLRSWARTVIEVLTWLGLIYIISFGAYWVYMWMSMLSQVPPEQMSTDISTFKYFGLAMGVVVNLMFGVPLIIMLVKLKGSVIKNAVK